MPAPRACNSGLRSVREAATLSASRGGQVRAGYPCICLTSGLFQIDPLNTQNWPLVRVVVERALDRPGIGDDGLTYGVPTNLGVLHPGERVEVPLGRGNKPAEGVVVGEVSGIEIPAGLDPRAIKPVTRRLGVSFEPSLIELAKWVSRYYCCPLGTTLSALIPAAVKKLTGRREQVVLERAPRDEPGSLTPMVRAAWEAIKALPGNALPLPPRELAARAGCKDLRAINRLIKLGLLTEKRIETVRAGAFTATIAGAAEPPELSARQAGVVEAITGTLGTFAGHLLLGVTGSGKTEVYLRVLERVIARGESAIVLVPEISLTPQTAGRFMARFAQPGGGPGVAVLHSGLTASQRHQQWRRVEAGEARVVVGARSAVFAPLPARTDPGAKFPLGLIVVDEEHDHSYKQDQAPRYHARDVALRRAQAGGFPVILGSATPSLESWHNATGTGRFRLHELPERVGGGALPRVDVVDMLDQRRQRRGAEARHVHALGPTLEHAVGRTLESGGQVILLLNRRGFANYICCPDQSCGWMMRCEYCDVTMVFHKGTGRNGEVAKWRDGSGAVAVGGAGSVTVPSTRHLATSPSRQLPLCRCHHCLAEQKLPDVCPVCGKRINTFGVGTQRLEEELACKFPSLVEGRTMLRLDADTMTRAQDYFEALDRFGKGEVRLLLGTQMIAKGLDFPNVRLVGVVNADTALNLPDFRAAERTFQLVSQVAGRAGRGERDGGGLDRVIVQTFNPTQPAIVAAANHDYRAFANEELELRRAAGLPPIGRMARIVCRDEDPAKAHAAAARIAAALADPGAPWAGELRFKGPMDCPISRIAGSYRVAVELLAPAPGVIQSALAALRNAGLAKSDEHTAVDVDPVALL